MPVVGVTVTADAAQQRKEIDGSMRQLGEFAKNVNVFNATAVKAFRESALAEKELNAQIGATVEQQTRLNSIITAFENKVQSAAVQTGNATEKMARGFSYVASQGTATASSINQIISAGGDLAFAFGPEGAIISGVLMVTAGIVAHFERAEAKMEETAQKFNRHVDDMLMNGDSVAAAKQAAKAFVDELEALDKLKTDTEQSHLKQHFGQSYGDLFTAIRARMNLGGDRDVLATAQTQGAAAKEAAMRLAEVEVHDKELDSLAKQRRQINDDIVRAQTKLAGMERKGHEDEYAATQRAIAAANVRLATAEKKTRELEEDRARRIALERGQINTPAGRAAFDIGVGGRQPADLGAEHGERNENLSRSGEGAGERAAARRDSDRARANTKAIEDQRRANEMILRLDDDAKQRTVKIAVDEAQEIAKVRDVALAEGLRNKKLGLDQIDQLIKDDLQAHLRVIDQEAAAETQKIDDQAAKDKDAAAQLHVSAQEHARIILAIEADQHAKQLEADARFHRDRQGAEDSAADAAARAAQKKADDEQRARETAARKAEAAAQAKERMIEGVVRGSIHSLSDAYKAVGRAILAAEVDPLIKGLQAESIRDFVKSGARFAVGDFVGGAEWAAAGGLLAAGAAELSSLIGGGGGGGSRSGGGGGGSGAGVALGTQSRSGDQTIKIEIVTVTKDQNGRETARTNQSIQRLSDLNTPIRVGALG